jgi:hypothetical protein
MACDLQQRRLQLVQVEGVVKLVVVGGYGERQGLVLIYSKSG